MYACRLATVIQPDNEIFFRPQVRSHSLAVPTCGVPPQCGCGHDTHPAVLQLSGPLAVCRGSFMKPGSHLLEIAWPEAGSLVFFYTISSENHNFYQV